jgi:rhodanese-related sulfurtransferase
MRRRHE